MYNAYCIPYILYIGNVIPTLLVCTYSRNDGKPVSLVTLFHIVELSQLRALETNGLNIYNMNQATKRQKFIFTVGYTIYIHM